MLDCADCGTGEDGSTCQFIPVNETWRRWDHGPSVALGRVTFVGNAAEGPGASGGAVALTNGGARFSLVTFAGNRASAVGGALLLSRSHYAVATAELTLEGCDFSRNAIAADVYSTDSTGSGSDLFSESSAKLTMRNSTFRAAAASRATVFEVSAGGEVHWSPDSVVHCHAGHQLDVLAEVVPYPTTPLPDWDNALCKSDVGPCPTALESCWPPMLQQTVAYKCSACPPATYSLGAGALVGGAVHRISCWGDCPYGGDCSAGSDELKARSGFFGFIKSLHGHNDDDDVDDGKGDDGKMGNVVSGSGGGGGGDDVHGSIAAEQEVGFVACPRGYCCDDGEELCSWDATCAGHRTGLLCGQCSDDYSASLFGSGCVANNLCDAWRSVATLELAKALAYAALFYFVPSAGFASPFALVVFHMQVRCGSNHT